MKKQLSIITVCYNEPDLEKTCKSIVNQTWQDFEWIVVDGGSNAETQEIWNKYKSRINVFVSEPDNGIYNAMNKGINLSNGKYLLFLNAGDYLYEDSALEKIFKNKNYDSDILYGNENIVKDENPDYIDYLPKKINKDFLYFSTLRHQASFIKKELFEKYGMYDENYRIVSDYEKWFVFLKNKASFEYIPYIISSVNVQGISSNPKSQDIAIKERQDTVNRHFTEKEIKKYEAYFNFKYNSFFERIFSIKPLASNNKIYKIITILGLKLKFKTAVIGSSLNEEKSYKIYYPAIISNDVGIGKKTYISPNSRISMTTIGKFCSIGPNFICGYGIHPINGISTAPCFYSTLKQNGMTYTSEDKIEERKRIIIGNDVFIGMNVSILDGITVADGAVIGAGAVVTKDVPPYAVVAGVPAKIIKYRFSEEQIEKLLKIKWWNFDDEKLQDVEKMFFDVDEFIEKYYGEVKL